MDLILDLNPTAWFVDLLFEGMVLTFNLNRTTWLVDLLCKGTDLTFNSNQTAWLDDLFWERMDLTFNRNEIAWLVALLWEGMDPTFNLNQTAWLVDLLCEIDQVVQLLTHFVILTRWSYCWPTLWYWPGGRLSHCADWCSAADDPWRTPWPTRQSRDMRPGMFLPSPDSSQWAVNTADWWTRASPDLCSIEQC